MTPDAGECAHAVTSPGNWCKTEFGVNREPNNGRSPVDFKVSYGSGDKSIIEFKLGSSTSLKRNLEQQIEIYEKANNTHKSI